MHGAGVVARARLARGATLVDPFAPYRAVRDHPLPRGFNDGELSERVLMLFAGAT